MSRRHVRRKKGDSVKSFVTATLIAALLVMAAIFGLSQVSADSNGLPQQFNGYRTNVCPDGAGSCLAPLTELATLDAAAQLSSDNACATNNYTDPSLPISGSWKTWGMVNFATASDVANFIFYGIGNRGVGDPVMKAIITDPNANAVGVGFTTCPIGWYPETWTIIVGCGVCAPTATPSPSPTPSPTPTPTPSPTPSPAPSPTLSPTPVPTPVGDVNCDGKLTALDALVILKAVAMGTTIPPCY
jgi:hypothetical protein